MTYHTHSLLGFVTAVITVKILNFLNIIDLSYLIEGSLFSPSLWQFYGGAIIGALMPDIDHASSKAGRALWFISKPLKIFGVKHRGITHSILGLVLFFFLTGEMVKAGWINELIWYGLVIGYLSHLIADMLNVHGIPLFYPNNKRFKFNTNITTGSWGEHLLFLLTFTIITLFISSERGLLNFSFNDFLTLIGFK
ncbi:metal-dependent hydrolase [Halonatronum saccharophilum]|uniref:metal-dependent hydrolase n=1 Tax=Halonatronum saccharophilum TaxID=150060 RepID=UPI0004805508|nr:metal-dependent hydrolase [Halonatronum saccharophilum]